MASGHVNRIYRPNTWQHRPSLRREDFSCQPGAVHTWHLTDISIRHLSMSDVGGQSGPRRGSLAISNFGRCWLIKRTFR